MNDILDFVVRNGPLVLFAVVFVEQMGLPLPAAPWMLVAGALSGSGRISGLLALLAVVFGSLLADMIWFYLGRYGGQRVLRLLCRISLEPDSCVRRTQDVFERYGMRGVVGSKFIPGLSTVVPPLAGITGVSTPRFLFFDGLGSFLYGGCFLLVGALFSHQMERILDLISRFGTGAAMAIIGLAALYIGKKYLQRRRLLNELRMARITVDELYRMQEAGENPVILDLRSHLDLGQDALLIPGALHMAIDEVGRRQHEIPRDRDVVLYCSCPNEVSSAKVALQLQRNGILRVRPLLGGIDAWRERSYPLEPRPVAALDALAIKSPVQQSSPI